MEGKKKDKWEQKRELGKGWKRRKESQIMKKGKRIEGVKMGRY